MIKSFKDFISENDCNNLNEMNIQDEIIEIFEKKIKDLQKRVESSIDFSIKKFNTKDEPIEKYEMIRDLLSELFSCAYILHNVRYAKDLKGCVKKMLQDSKLNKSMNDDGFKIYIPSLIKNYVEKKITY